MYNRCMLIIVPAILIIGLFIWLFTRTDSDSHYEKTQNFIDFNPGKDSNKVGDPKYPNAGPDSVMKHEFLDSLFDDKKQ